MKISCFLFVWCFLTQFTISAQEVGKMNKSELKEHVQLLTKKVDSLSSEITLSLSYLENKRVEVNRLNKLLEELEAEKKQKLVEKEAVIAMHLKNNIKKLICYF